MLCPKCGLINPSSALRCDCGYDFSSGQIEKSYLEKPRKIQQSPKLIDNAQISIGPFVGMGVAWILAIIVFSIWNCLEIKSENPRLTDGGTLLLFCIPALYGFAAWRLFLKKWPTTFFFYLLASLVDFFFAQASRSGDLRVPIARLPQLLFLVGCAIGTRLVFERKSANNSGTKYRGIAFVIGSVLLIISLASATIIWTGPLGNKWNYGSSGVMSSYELLSKLGDTSKMAKILKTEIEEDRNGRIRLSYPVGLAAIFSIGLMGLAFRKHRYLDT